MENKNTGDIVYQLNNLNLRILKIQNHLKIFRKDFNSKYSLYKLVGRRRKYIKYLKNTDFERFNKFILDSNLRISKSQK